MDQNNSLLTLVSPPRAPSPGPRTGIVVFSGGSAANSLVDVFEGVRDANRATLSYVIPISDNGGSTSEIIRVFGGPGTAFSMPSLQFADIPRHRRRAVALGEAHS